MKMDKTTRTAASAGIGGAIVGAGIAAVATKVLSDKKNRQKAGAVLEDIKKRITEVAKSEALKPKKTANHNSRSASSRNKKGVSASTKVSEGAKKVLQPKTTTKSESST